MITGEAIHSVGSSFGNGASIILSGERRDTEPWYWRLLSPVTRSVNSL